MHVRVGSSVLGSPISAVNCYGNTALGRTVVSGFGVSVGGWMGGCVCAGCTAKATRGKMRKWMIPNKCGLPWMQMSTFLYFLPMIHSAGGYSCRLI